jgi:hypothetical protein
MVDFFYGLPMWAATVLILGLSLAVGLASSFGVRRAFRLQSSEDDREHAVSLMQVVAAYIGILIAFAGVQVWQDFSDAQNGVHKEAAAAAELYRDLNTYGPETLPQKQALRAYMASIITDEWPLLSQGQPSPRTEIALFRLFQSIGRIHPKDDRDSAIYSEAFSNLNDLVGLRRDRLIHSESGMPIILWVVGLVGSVLIVSYTATFKASRTNVMMICGISLALGLVFLFILIVDRPYKGAFSVDRSEMVELSAKFDLLDRLAAEQNSTPLAQDPNPR